MREIGIIGNFSLGQEAEGGQTIKTRIIAEELIKKYHKKEVMIIDTNNWKKNKFRLLFNCFLVSCKAKNILVLPAHNGIRIFIPLFLFLTKIFRKKLHYIVVGAWLADELKKNTKLLNKMKKVNYIYVQTNTLKEKLKEISIINNVYIMPNFKLTVPVNENELISHNCSPYNVCIFSRINSNKGIEDAIQVVNKINHKNKGIIVKLDIFGPIESEYEEKFYKLVKHHSSIVTYKGIVQYDKTTEVLKNYYLLLFPTRYYTEGFPGTIIDAYLSGLPILASKWESCYDILVEGKTGYSYQFMDNEDFELKLEFLLKNNDIVEEMKFHCLEEAKKYTSENVISILTNKF